MVRNNRVDTLRILIGTNQHLQNTVKLPAIYRELEALRSVQRSNKPDGLLLNVLHATRALDTTLQQHLDNKGWLVYQGRTANALGKYLHRYKAHGILTGVQQINYQYRLVDRRNKYMHQAGAMPDKSETNIVVSEMEALITLILSSPGC